MRIFLILALVLVGCKAKKPIKNQNVVVDFSTPIHTKVTKIDSIDNYFLIYSKAENKKYKLVSKKNNSKSSCKPIQIDSLYTFRVVQLTNVNSPKHDSEIPEPINYLDLEKCISFGNTKICNEPRMEVYKVNNLTGLCLLTKVSK